MIREITQNDIVQCVKVIRESFETVAKEFNITEENGPRFTAFANLSTYKFLFFVSIFL